MPTPGEIKVSVRDEGVDPFFRDGDPVEGVTYNQIKACHAHALLKRAGRRDLFNELTATGLTSQAITDLASAVTLHTGEDLLSDPSYDHFLWEPKAYTDYLLLRVDDDSQMDAVRRDNRETVYPATQFERSVVVRVRRRTIPWRTLLATLGLLEADVLDTSKRVDGLATTLSSITVSLAKGPQLPTDTQRVTDAAKAAIDQEVLDAGMDWIRSLRRRGRARRNQESFPETKVWGLSKLNAAKTKIVNKGIDQTPAGIVLMTKLDNMIARVTAMNDWSDL